MCRERGWSGGRAAATGMSGPLLIGLADSAASSLGNLGVSVVAARLTSLPGFGLFATAMLVLILGTMACAVPTARCCC